MNKPILKAKPKWKTTEFYVQIAVMIMSLLIMSGVVEIGSGLDKGIAMITMALSTLGYTYARTTIKRVTEDTKGKAKPGFKTTEFWFNAVSLVGSAVVSSGAVEGSEVDKVLGLVTAGITSAGYGPLRSQLKEHGIKLVMVFSLTLVGCTGPSLKAVQSRYKAIAEEYYNGVHDSKDYTDSEKELRDTTIGAWRIDAELRDKEWGVAAFKKARQERLAKAAKDE